MNNISNKRFRKEVNLYANQETNFNLKDTMPFLKASNQTHYIEDCYYYHSDNDSVTLKILVENKILTVKIVCNTGYPFKPPAIFVNNIKYISLLRPTQLFHIYGKFLNVSKCLCCSTILCDWNLLYGFKHILTEVKNNFIIKNRLRRMIYAKKIMNKKLGFEINNLYYFV